MILYLALAEYVNALFTRLEIENIISSPTVLNHKPERIISTAEIESLLARHTHTHTHTVYTGQYWSCLQNHVHTELIVFYGFRFAHDANAPGLYAAEWNRPF